MNKEFLVEVVNASLLINNEYFRIITQNYILAMIYLFLFIYFFKKIIFNNNDINILLLCTMCQYRRRYQFQKTRIHSVW